MFFKKSQKEISEEVAREVVQEVVREDVAKKGIKKMDAMITGAILWGVVASLYGVKKLKDGREQKILETTESLAEKVEELSEKVEQKTVIVEEKKWFFSKIFSKNK